MGKLEEIIEKLEDELKSVRIENLQNEGTLYQITKNLEDIEKEGETFLDSRPELNEAKLYKNYTIQYYNLVKRLTGDIKKRENSLDFRVYDHLCFFLEKVLIFSERTISEHKNAESCCFGVYPEINYGIMGNIYLWFGKFISKNKKIISKIGSLKNLAKIVKKTDPHFNSSVRKNGDDLAKLVFEKAKEKYEKSRALGNDKKENDGKLGEVCFELATLSEKPLERYKHYLEAILNFESSRFKENREIENYSYISNSWQELGHLVSCVDLYLSYKESGQVIELTNNLFEKYKQLFQNITHIKGEDKLNEIHGFFKDLKVFGNSRFERDVVRSVAINLLERALKGYGIVFNQRIDNQEDSSAEDYSYRGKCKLRLGRLKNAPHLIDGALSDLEKAVELRDNSPQIHNLLSQAHFVKGHDHIHDVTDKETEFLKALNESTISERLKNTKREFYSSTSEIYRHLLKLEFTKDNPDAQRFDTYLNEAVRYAQKAEVAER